MFEDIYPGSTSVILKVKGQCVGVLATIFTARCTLVQSAVLRSHVVCLSVQRINSMSMDIIANRSKNTFCSGARKIRVTAVCHI